MYRITIILACFFAVLSCSGILAEQFSEELTQRQTAMTNLSAGSLAFTENRGQWGEKTLFKAEAGGATFYFCKDEVAYLFTRNTDELLEDDLGKEDFGPVPEETGMPGQRYKRESLLIKAQFLNANPDVVVAGEGLLNHKCNYFYGNDPSKWQTNVPSYSSVTYRNIYPGIDLKYYGDNRSMKYDFIVYPGADISQIRIGYDNAENLTVTPAGDLQAHTAFGLVNEKTPYMYQEINGKKQEVAGRYELKETGVFGFVVDEGYNYSYPLIIDPELLYSTYIGGSSEDRAYRIAVDNAGNSYVVGKTESIDFPAINPYDESYNNGEDVFLFKLSSSGNSLIYSTYLGGENDDSGQDIAIDADGYIYITGFTSSQDFPAINSIDSAYNGDFFDIFIAKLSNSGDSLMFSTYIGGERTEKCYGIAIDNDGCLNITGRTNSYNFPTVNPYDDSFNGGDTRGDIFISKLSSAGDSLLYSTYLGGSFNDVGLDIAVDDSNNYYITGYSWSADFPMVNPFDGTIDENEDVIVLMLSSAGDSILYSTYLGTRCWDIGYAIAVDNESNVYVTGRTFTCYPCDFPTVNAFDDSCYGHEDVFVAMISPSIGGVNSLLYSTYIGGAGEEIGRDIIVDNSGCVYVTGLTGSATFPRINHNNYDISTRGVFLLKMKPSLGGSSSVVFSTSFGGDGYDEGFGLSISPDGNIFITGITYSTDFPTINPYDESHNGDGDVFVSKFGPGGSITGIVTNELAEPIESVLVSSELTTISSTTNAIGEYYLGGLGVGSHNIVFSHPEYIDTTIYGIVVYQDETITCNVEMNKAGYTYLPGDANMYNGVWQPAVLGADVTYLINYFRAMETSQPCLLDGFWCSADANGDCSIIGSDATRLINYLRGVGEIEYCPDYPPAWETSGDLPAEAPAGWPNCE